MSTPGDNQANGKSRSQNGRARRGRGGGQQDARGRHGSNGQPPGLVKSQSTQSVKPAAVERQPSAATTAVAATAEDEESELEPCFICAEPIQYSAITACNHRTCHICALRLRALYKNHFCAYCKDESRTVLFTLPSEKPFTDYGPEDVTAQDVKLGISFETPTIMEETMILLRFNCPVDTCDVSAAGWPDLKLHIKQAHNQLLCDLCVKNKKVFTHEHDLFSKQGLTNHFKYGNRNTEGDDGFKGHPECGFCRRAFYDDDELYKHCRDKHERCHVCDQLDNGPGRAQYFQDYAKLDQHFRREHYVCPDPGCLEQKFVVFGSELDLKAHQLEAHPNGMSGQALRSARKINTTFAGYEGPANARGNRRGQADIQFQSSSSSGQHLSRDQQALQRQHEYRQARARLTGFGTALSEPNPAPAPTPPPPQAAMQVPVPSPAVQRAPLIEAFPALGAGSGSTITKTKLKKNESGTNTSNGAAPDVSKHQAILDRVSMAASYDNEKVALFKTNMAQYRSTNITAPELISNLHDLLRVSVEVLGSIITGAADVLDSEARRLDLLVAWNDWKVKRAASSSTSFNTTNSNSSTPAAGSGGGQRILNIKNRASRTASQTHSVWTSASRGGGSNSVASALARGKDPVSAAAHQLSHLQVQSGGRPRANYTPAWTSSSSAAAAGMSSSNSATHSTTHSGTATPIAQDFPSLPQGTRKRIDTSKYFASGWGNSNAAINGHGQSSAGIGPEDYEDFGETPVPAPATTAKGKKKPKKQLLFSQGLQRGS